MSVTKSTVYGALVLASVFIAAAAARAEDVPQFRGKGASGVSKAKGLPLTWNEKDNIRWKAALPGRGLSNPVIAAGRVYVTACTRVNQDRLHVLCYDEGSGKQLWERQFWATGTTQCHPKTNMAAPTPITDGERVYALFATGDLACLTKTGDLLWYRSLVGDYPTIGNNVGMAASPTISGDMILVAMENVGESFLAGVDKNTGMNSWRVERPRGINWVTPLVLGKGGQAEVVVQGPGDLTAYDVATGKKKWAVTDQSFGTIPSPVFAEGKVFTASGKFFAIEPGSAKSEPKIVWQSGKLSTGYTSPIAHEGRVYALSSRGVLSCADATTGKTLWDLRAEGNYSASPLHADGKLYLVSEEGTTTVVEPGAHEGKIVATNALPETFLASPVASGSALFLRSDKHLYCVGAAK